MKNIFIGSRVVIAVITLMIFIAGLILALLGVYELIMVFAHLGASDADHVVRLIAVGLLQAVDLFLISIVFFVLSLGITMLFKKADEPLPIQLPEWLQVKNFMQLKMILWEAILTTLVVSYLAGLVKLRIAGESIKIETLILPGGVLLIALSLFFLKKGEPTH